jgi:hypothetical protein
VEYDGNFSEFWYHRYGTSVRAPAGKKRQSEQGGQTAEKRARNIGEAKKKNDRFSATGIERRIIALEQERERLEREMNGAYSAGKLKEARETGNRLAEMAKLIDRLYADWN